MARRAAALEGVWTGPSGGANLVAALRLAGELGPGHRVVTIQPDSGLKYLHGDLYQLTARATARRRTSPHGAAAPRAGQSRCSRASVAAPASARRTRIRAFVSIAVRMLKDSAYSASIPCCRRPATSSGACDSGTSATTTGSSGSPSAGRSLPSSSKKRSLSPTT